MNISITGDLGSGKTTVCKELSEHFGWNHVSTGNVFRQIADERGVTDFATFIRDHDPQIDEDVDERIKGLGRTSDTTIFDSRMAWYFVPDSFKVKLTCDLETTAERVMEQIRDNPIERQGERFDTLDECKAALLKRKSSEEANFSKLGYPTIHDSDFDMVIKTDNLSVDEIARLIDMGAKAKERRETHEVSHPSRDIVEGLRRDFPRGARVSLDWMNDRYESIPIGTRGTVTLVDDMGTIHVNWDSGEDLGVVFGVDACHVTNEPTRHPSPIDVGKQMDSAFKMMNTNETNGRGDHVK